MLRLQPGHVEALVQLAKVSRVQFSRAECSSAEQSAVQQSRVQGREGLLAGSLAHCRAVVHIHIVSGFMMCNGCVYLAVQMAHRRHQMDR